MKNEFNNIKFRRFTLVRNRHAFSIQTRQIEYTDITVCLEGKMTYYLNGEKIDLHSGDAIIFPKGCERMRTLSESPVSYASFNVFHQNDTGFSLSGLIPDAIDKKDLTIIELFATEWKNASPFRTEKCAALFSYLISSLLESVNDGENKHIRTIKRYVRNNISKEITLEEIANLLHFAPPYVCALFKKNTGMTIIEYVNAERIRVAKEEILTSDTPLFEIAERNGFKNYTYFSNLFKKLTGKTPSDFRKMIE
jgi:two-component system response regulator YesN